MLKRFKTILASLLVLLAVYVVPAVLAQAPDSDASGGAGSAVGNSMMDRLKNIATGGYNPSTDKFTLSFYIGYLLTVMFALFGTIFTLLIFYAGYNWMTANGDKTKVEKAQKIIMASVIGLIIVISSYAVWQFVYNRIVKGQ